MSSNDLFTTLREKRERHKKEKLCGESKVEADTMSGTTQAKPQTEASSSQPKPAAATAAPVSAVVTEPVAEVKTQQMETCGSIMSSTKKPQYTPSVTPSLFELYVNGDQCDRMDLNSMLEHMSQYIYAFCKAHCDDKL